jgi:hypothetical protein
MPRRTYDGRAHRARPPEQRSDWSWLVDLLAAQRRAAPPPQQTPAIRAGKQRNTND